MPTSVPREIELKLELDPKSLQALRDHHLGSIASDEVTRQRLTSVYFDTKKLSLHKKGISLRVRREGSRNLQTLKSAEEGGSGLFDRLEWNVDIAGDRPDLSRIADSPFGPILDTEGLRRRLKPVFKTDVDRTVWRVRSGGAEVEIALDEGRVTAGDKTEEFAELELELKNGPRSELFKVAWSLVPADALRLGVLAKSERGYALLATETPPSFKADPVYLTPNASTEDAFRVIVQGCIRHFRLNEPLLIQTRGSEPLHQCRVALRRLRTAMSLFKEVIRDDQVEELTERLRSLTQKLGEARDLDVFLGKLREPHGERAEAAPETDELVKQTAKDREQAYNRVLAALRGKRHQALMFDILAWSEDGPWLSSSDQATQTRRREPIESFAADVLDRRTRRIRRRGRNLEELDPPARHDVRIEAKKIRYATEFFASLATTKKRRRRHETFSTALVSLQEHLGELNDLATGDNLARNAGQRAGAALGLGGRTAGAQVAKSSLKAATSAFREIAKAKPFWGSASTPAQKR